jgi:flavin-dependent dehydrogenase
LLDQLNNEGTELLRGWSIVNCKKETNGWTVTMLDPQNNREELFCEFIVDATGRPCRIARALGIQRARLDLLTGIAACFTLRKFNKPHYTYIEAVEQGWWYAAPLTGMRLATTFMTDTDLLDPLILNADHYLETISSTTMIADLLVGGITSKDIQITSCTASTSYLEKRFGDGWLAVGDAAFAYDPISSYGITSALDGGYYAGNAIADTLDGYKEALPAYDWLISGAFTIYKEMYQHQYQLEQRWPQGAFWKRRHDMA